MESHYHQLCAEERACIMQMTHQGLSLRHISAVLRRAPSLTSRGISRYGLKELEAEVAVILNGDSLKAANLLCRNDARGDAIGCM